MTDDVRYDIGLEETSEITGETSKLKKVEGAKKPVEEEDYGLHLIWQDIVTAAELIHRIIFPPGKRKTWQIWHEWGGLQYYSQASSREVAEQIAEHARSIFLDEVILKKLTISDKEPVYESYEEYMVKQGIEMGIKMCLFFKR